MHATISDKYEVLILHVTDSAISATHRLPPKGALSKKRHRSAFTVWGTRLQNYSQMLEEHDGIMVDWAEESFNGTIRRLYGNSVWIQAIAGRMLHSYKSRLKQVLY